MSMGVKSHIKLSSKLVNNQSLNNRASTTLMNSRKNSMSKWFHHRGMAQKYEISKEKYKLKFNNSDCFPLIRDQYSRYYSFLINCRFLNFSRQTTRKSTPLSFYSNYNVASHNKNRVK